MYYKALGIDRTATQEEISVAYKKLRSSAHPDKCGTQAQFIKIQKAYEVLSDPLRRKCFDETGDDGSAPQDSPVNIVSVMIMQLIDTYDVEYLNLLNIARLSIIENKKNLENTARNLDSRAIKRENAAKRISHKTGGDNFISTLILNNASELKAQASKCRSEQSELDALISVIEEMEYKVDERTSHNFMKNQDMKLNIFKL